MESNLLFALWALGFSVGGALIAGCSQFEAARDAALLTNPATGTNPLEDLVSGAGEVASFPAFVPGWFKIVGAVATIVAAAFGYHKLNAKFFKFK